MLVHLGVLFAFFCAGPAGSCAGLHGRGNDLLIAAGTANPNCACRDTEVSAILVQPDALAKLVHHVFREAGVSARDACLGARVAFLKAADQRFVGIALDAWMSGDHFLHVVHRISPVEWKRQGACSSKEALAEGSAAMSQGEAASPPIGRKGMCREFAWNAEWVPWHLLAVIYPSTIDLESAAQSMPFNSMRAQMLASTTCGRDAGPRDRRPRERVWAWAEDRFEDSVSVSVLACENR
ncbi:hypothetical protein GRI40_12200 [Altererythrobacter aerius]|uniref:Uncharacterized protein n=1 Tax=Tsuneonella aeria TaxID=1837929 RepID=A0A6I4TH61_9SPHN|nr:hypothetical protein [Tsuneonella aeria]MXO75977.1 hypothetical protein [Tsuneonella aeria]